MKTKVYLDMDGTIADLYSQENWLDKLKREESNLFRNLVPMITEEELFDMYPEDEFDIRILSMTPKGASDRYIRQVEFEKDEWLAKHFPKLRQGKRIYMKYGMNKNLKGCANAILIDDNAEIRKRWKGTAIMPTWC